MTIRKLGKTAQIIVTMGSVMLTTACAVGPDYVRPTAPVSNHYKENKELEGQWQPANPKDASPRGPWWTVFEDNELNHLMEQTASNNQTILASEAAYRQAQALVAHAWALFFPVLSLNPSLSRSHEAVSSTSSLSGTRTTATLPLQASWEPDLWGSVRRNIELDRANMEASAATLESTKLSTQSTLAQAYFQLRMTDQLARLLNKTIKTNEDTVRITENLYKEGLDSAGDLAQAKSQLALAKAQLTDIGIARAQYEHAIAVLTGKPPAEFSLTPNKDALATLPNVPVGLPSELLERRPDIATAERNMAAANAQIGIATAAFFPSLSLNASGGYSSSTLSNWLTLPNRIWSLGPSIAFNLLNGATNLAQRNQALAAYDQAVANYRQIVLNAFQQVEDNLSTLRLLAQESAEQEDAVKASQEALRVYTNQYTAGTISYINVLNAQITALNNERSLLSLEGRRYVASVLLIAALGGDWKTTHLAQK